MEKNQTTQNAEQGLAYWENEVKYFDDALEGLRRTFGIISSLREMAEKQVEELLPEREEVE